VKDRVTTDKTLRLLGRRPTLSELRRQFPAEWERVQQRIATAVERARPEDLTALLERPTATPRFSGLHARRRDQGKRDAIVSRYVEHRMACLLVKSYSLSAATGVTKGKIRFNWLNGYCAQRLFFGREFERKPTSLFWFRLVWPLLWQKKFLMPLVETKGIYCFYSRELVAKLASLIGARRCLEIGAGDGTLARFLAQYGVRITATDDHSWAHSIRYPPDVVNCDAKEALERYRPEVVVCSWPPAGNAFERHVFRIRSVQTYIVIGSRLQFASGNWADYRNQSSFLIAEDPDLSRLVLPPELGSAVYVFQRIEKTLARSQAPHGEVRSSE